MEKSKLKLYAHAVSHALENDAEPFRSLLCHGLKLLELGNVEAAKALGVSRPTIVRWKSGKVHPSFVTRFATLVTLSAKVLTVFRLEETTK